MNATERELRTLALNHACPTCRAHVGVRCRTVTGKPTGGRK